MRYLGTKLSAVGKILRHFDNPMLTLGLRLGLIETQLFPYRLQAHGHSYTVLARPSSSDCSDLFVMREVLVDESYMEILPLLPERPIRFIDIGANLGSFALWISKKRMIEAGYCFEPEPDSAKLCRFNLDYNSANNITLVQTAIGGRTRQVRMAICPSRPGSNNIYGESTSGDLPLVDVISLESFMENLDRSIDVAKIDCEGAEWEILRTTPEDVWRKIEIVLFEVHVDPEGRSKVSEFQKLIEARGYRTMRWDNSGDGLYIGVRPR